MNYTTIEQSKKLVELGLSPDTADMHYPDYYFDSNAKGPCNTSYKDAIEDLFHVYINPKTKRLLPCWSLGALMEIMPKIHEDDNDNGCYPTLCKGWDNELWHCVYRYSIHITEWYSDSIEAAFEMVCWLLENDYIKKDK